MKYVLFGAGDAGRKLLGLLDRSEVVAFVDNDIKRKGEMINGIPVETPKYLETVSEDTYVVISVFEEYQEAITNQLLNMGIDRYITSSDLLKNMNVPSDAGIKTLQNKFEGKRCFVIGTGPSLRIADLNMLKKHKEITFASNKIFKIFDKTSWRPDLYCISDIDVFAYYYDTVCSLNIPYQFLINMKNTKYENLDFSKLKGNNKYVFNVFKETVFDRKRGKNVPRFSTEPDKYIIDGGITVTYSMLQWAYFLGFKEIYLLGIDFNYEDLSGKDEKKKDHFCPDYIEKNEIVNYPRMKESMDAYQVAREFADTHDFHIYNATRGGKLEVFQRIAFDTLF